MKLIMLLRDKEKGRAKQRQTEPSTILSITLTLAALFIRQELVKNIGQRQNWRLNYFRNNLYDFLWERSRKSWAVKAVLQPWLGHTDIDLTVKTGAGELWCHDSVLSLCLSVKEDGELEEEERRTGWVDLKKGKSGGRWVRDCKRQVGIKQMN